jgi:hypothetical protein
LVWGAGEHRRELHAGDAPRDVAERQQHPYVATLNPQAQRS